jgi:hypothetical protein
MVDYVYSIGVLITITVRLVVNLTLVRDMDCYSNYKSTLPSNPTDFRYCLKRLMVYSIDR